MDTLQLNVGEKVALQTKDREWTGSVLESHEPEIILLKLESGYNIGVRESEIIDARVIEKAKNSKEKKIALKPKKNLPNIAMIVTGGTISARLDPKTGGTTWTTVDDLFKIAPELHDICNITSIETPFLKGSEDMSAKDWKIIAETAEKLLNDDSIEGLIITQGTDTLHYSSAAFSFFIRNLNKPVAFTFSQRSIDRGSTDAHLNLIAAAKFATSEIAEVAVAGHDTLNDTTCAAISGTKVRKCHTSRRNAFRPINDTPIAIIDKENIKILKDFEIKDKNKKVQADTKYSNKVALVKFTPGAKPDILDFYAKEGYKGIIIETVGLGQVAGKDAEHNWLPTIKRLIKEGITICATAQTVWGSLNQNVYSTGRELKKTGIINLKDMLSETAYIKLSWVLGHKDWDPKEKMLENISGEFNNRLGFQDF